MIVDLSYPPAWSVNDRIDPEQCSRRYSSIDEAIRSMVRLRPGTLLLKVEDLNSAYCMVPVHPLDRHLLGIQWEGHLYVDMALSFACDLLPLCSRQLRMHWAGH